MKYLAYLIIIILGLALFYVGMYISWFLWEIDPLLSASAVIISVAYVVWRIDQSEIRINR